MLTVAYVYKFKHQSVFSVSLNQYPHYEIYWLIFSFVICVLCWNLSYAVMNTIWFMIIFEHIFIPFSEDIKCRYGQSRNCCVFQLRCFIIMSYSCTHSEFVRWSLLYCFIYILPFISPIACTLSHYSPCRMGRRTGDFRHFF